MTSRPAGRSAFAWRPVALSVLLAACASPEPEDPWAGIPQRPLAEARMNLPSPGVDGAFVFDGVSAYEDDVIQSLRLTVEPGEFRGEPAWYAVQESVQQRGPNLPMARERTTAWFSQDLRVLSWTVDPPTPRSAPADATWTLAGALIFLRACPAEVAAYVGESPRDTPGCCLCVAEIDADGRIHATAPTADEYLTHILLSGAGRDVVEIQRTLGWHRMGRIVPRAPAGK
jgi:hypothetical protein